MKKQNVCILVAVLVSKKLTEGSFMRGQRGGFQVLNNNVKCPNSNNTWCSGCQYCPDGSMCPDCIQSPLNLAEIHRSIICPDNITACNGCQYCPDGSMCANCIPVVPHLCPYAPYEPCYECSTVCSGGGVCPACSSNTITGDSSTTTTSSSTLFSSTCQQYIDFSSPYHSNPDTCQRFRSKIINNYINSNNNNSSLILTDIEICGYEFITTTKSTTVIPAVLYNKKELGRMDETGLGLINDPTGQYEITASSFIQLSLPYPRFNPIRLKPKVMFASVTGSESYAFYGSNIIGERGNKIENMQSLDGNYNTQLNYFSLPTTSTSSSSSNSQYISISAVTGNVLLAAYTSQCDSIESYCHIHWDFTTKHNNLQSCETYSSTLDSTYHIKACGYFLNGTATELYGKYEVSDGSERGLGLRKMDTTQHEITIRTFIQLDLNDLYDLPTAIKSMNNNYNSYNISNSNSSNNIYFNNHVLNTVQIKMGSVTGDEYYVFYGSNVTGVLGTPVSQGNIQGADFTVFPNVFNNSSSSTYGYRYLSVIAGRGNVLLHSLSVNCTIASSSSTNTITPTLKPTTMPSSNIPSSGPSAVPVTVLSSLLPVTIIPSKESSITPITIEQSLHPSMTPSVEPSISPVVITTSPTVEPSLFPITITPTIIPSIAPVSTITPTITSTTTTTPTSTPIFTPTVIPTINSLPSNQPTIKPIAYYPSQLPSQPPLTTAVTCLPSQTPTVQPSLQQSPSFIPTVKPVTSKPVSTYTPSATPISTYTPSSIKPTLFPSKIPTQKPSYIPTQLPSLRPNNCNNPFDFSSPQLSLGISYTYNAKSSSTLKITAYGYNINGNTEILCGKRWYGLENGLGLCSQYEDEITSSTFVQLDFSSLYALNYVPENAYIMITSVTFGDSFSIHGSNSKGILGTALTLTTGTGVSGTSGSPLVSDKYIPLPQYRVYKYYSVTAITGNVIINSVLLGCTVSSSTSLTPLATTITTFRPTSISTTLIDTSTYAPTVIPSYIPSVLPFKTTSPTSVPIALSHKPTVVPTIFTTSSATTTSPSTSNNNVCAIERDVISLAGANEVLNNCESFFLPLTQLLLSICGYDISSSLTTTAFAASTRSGTHAPTNTAFINTAAIPGDSSGSSTVVGTPAAMYMSYTDMLTYGIGLVTDASGEWEIDTTGFMQIDITAINAYNTQLLLNSNMNTSSGSYYYSLAVIMASTYPDQYYRIYGSNQQAVLYSSTTATTIATDLLLRSAIEGEAMIIESIEKYNYINIIAENGNALLADILLLCSSIYTSTPPPNINTTDVLSIPTYSPTIALPSYIPTRKPSKLPSHKPTLIPSVTPSFAPTFSCQFDTLNFIGNNIVLDVCHTFIFPQTSYQIPICGYDSIDVATTGNDIFQPVKLYASNNGENNYGLGIVTDPSGLFKIPVTGFTQLDITVLNYGHSPKLMIGSDSSISGGDGVSYYAIYGSYDKGQIGTFLLTYSSVIGVFIELPMVQKFNYISVTAFNNEVTLMQMQIVCNG